MPIKRLYRLQRARLTATPLALRPQLGLKATLFRYVLLVGLLLCAAYAGLRYGEYQQKLVLTQRSQQNQNQMQTRQQQIDALQNEKMLLAQQLTVVGAERDALKRDLTTLQQDAAATRETLSFFESLLQSNDRSRTANFVTCDLQSLAPDRARYRLLLVQGTDKTTELAGRLSLTLQYSDGGKKQKVTQGDGGVIQVKHYHRAEGELILPATAQGPLLLEARFLDPQDSNKVLASCQKKI